MYKQAVLSIKVRTMQIPPNSITIIIMHHTGEIGSNGSDANTILAVNKCYCAWENIITPTLIL